MIGRPVLRMHEEVCPAMRVTRLRGSCPDDKTCPTLYATDRGTAIVQGYLVTDPEVLATLGLPEGEAAVEVPMSLLEQRPETTS